MGEKCINTLGRHDGQPTYGRDQHWAKEFLEEGGEQQKQSKGM